MKHETLYKRTKTGAIQSYEIWVDSPADTTDGNPVIMKSTGQLDGKKILHSETIYEGKNLGRSNETTPLEQAESQALSDWTKKHDEGYKSVSDLGVLVGPTDEDYPSVKHIFDPILKNFLEERLPKFNSDANGNVKPMLATDWKKIKKVEYPCYIQPKLDGVRCLMIVRFNVGQEQVVTFLSRSGKEYTTLNHIGVDLGIYCFKKGEDPVDFILDGEIYSDEISFQELIQAVKKQYPNSLKLKFRAYDIVTEDDQEERLQLTQHMVRQIGSEHVTMVETQIVGNPMMVKMLHDEYVQDGNEGAMLRLFKGTYGQGQRSRDLLKVKEFNETEYEIIGGKSDKESILVGSGTVYDPQEIRVIDSFTFTCKTTDGQTFDAKVVGSRDYRAKLMNDIKSIIGKQATIKHFGFTDSGLPRFPIGKSIRDYE